MNVYLAWYDNSEEYEDAFVYLKGIFATKDIALGYIKSEGYTDRMSDYYYIPKPEVPKQCEFGVPLDRYEECYECNVCDKECCFNEIVDWAYDHSFMYVEEREVIGWKN